ncbi:MAG TPA: LamG-like jellyroll fold domain-containing protein [Xanthobacteraceae bacterium]|nr:LamG-like jellyroll fold domain-containing protein [Xanthobacteraceae bacterium]
MAAYFNGTDQYLSYTLPSSVSAPWSAGYWFRPDTVDAATRCVFSIMNSGTTGSGWDLEYDVANGLGFWAASAGSWFGATTTAPTAGQWHYAVCRAISSTNRRLAVLRPDGSTSHAQNTTSVTPAGCTAVTIAALRESTPALHMNGSVAEFWFANVDPVPDGGQMPDDILRRLALNGPFSLRSLQSNIIIYRSLFQSLARDEIFGDIYWGGNTQPQSWSNVNGAIVTDHPPFAATFKPMMVSKPLPI